MGNVEWLFADEPVSVKEVESAGKQMEISFPEDYVACASENHGASVKPYVFRVGNVERVFGSLLSYEAGDDEYILDVYDDYKDTLPKGVIPFAFDPAGNLICFDYKGRGEDPIVVFWEHENAWEKEELMADEGLTVEEAEERARENVFYVADGFTAFLRLLHE